MLLCGVDGTSVRLTPAPSLMRIKREKEIERLFLVQKGMSQRRASKFRTELNLLSSVTYSRCLRVITTTTAPTRPFRSGGAGTTIMDTTTTTATATVTTTADRVSAGSLVPP